jgi:hypothetical protein
MELEAEATLVAGLMAGLEGTWVVPLVEEPLVEEPPLVALPVLPLPL